MTHKPHDANRSETTMKMEAELADKKYYGISADALQANGTVCNSPNPNYQNASNQAQPRTAAIPVWALSEAVKAMEAKIDSLTKHIRDEERQRASYVRILAQTQDRIDAETREVDRLSHVLREMLASVENAP